MWSGAGSSRDVLEESPRAPTIISDLKDLNTLSNLIDLNSVL
jgi:hypothetical protein